MTEIEMSAGSLRLTFVVSNNSEGELFTFQSENDSASRTTHLAIAYCHVAHSESDARRARVQGVRGDTKHDQVNRDECENLSCLCVFAKRFILNVFWKVCYVVASLVFRDE